MCASALVILHVREEYVAQVPLAEYDDVINRGCAAIRSAEFNDKNLFSPSARPRGQACNCKSAPNFPQVCGLGRAHFLLLGAVPRRLRYTNRNQFRASNGPVMAAKVGPDTCALLDEECLLAVEAAGIGTWRWDLATNAVSLSSRSRELIGVPKASVDYPEFLARLHPDDRDLVDRSLRRSSWRAGNTISTSVRCRRTAKNIGSACADGSSLMKQAPLRSAVS